ncbi:MAG: hypothetical protein QM758_03840 [Armatimonas sp.]
MTDEELEARKTLIALHTNVQARFEEQVRLVQLVLPSNPELAHTLAQEFWPEPDSTLVGLAVTLWSRTDFEICELLFRRLKGGHAPVAETWLCSLAPTLSPADLPVVLNLLTCNAGDSQDRVMIKAVQSLLPELDVEDLKRLCLALLSMMLRVNIDRQPDAPKNLIANVLPVIQQAARLDAESQKLIHRRLVYLVRRSPYVVGTGRVLTVQVSEAILERAAFAPPLPAQIPLGGGIWSLESAPESSA